MFEEGVIQDRVNVQGFQKICIGWVSMGVHEAKDSPLHLVLLIKFKIKAAFRVKRLNKFFVGIWHGGIGQSLSLIHISEPTRLGMISYAVFCLKKKKKKKKKIEINVK